MSIWQNLRLQWCYELHSPSSSSSWYHSIQIRAAELHYNDLYPVPWMGMAALSQFTSVQIQLLCLGTLLRSDHSQSLPLLAAGKHTNTRSMDWKNSENSKGDVLHPELPLLFCKVKAKAMSATVPREMTAKTILMISFILLHSCSQPNRETSPGFIKLTIQCKAHSTNPAGQGAPAVSAECCWGLSGETWQKMFMTITCLQHTAFQGHNLHHTREHEKATENNQAISQPFSSQQNTSEDQCEIALRCCYKK